MKEYIFVSTIEENYSLWNSIYEGEIKEKGTINNINLPQYFESSNCIFRKKCNSNTIRKIEELINYSRFHKGNLPIVYSRNQYNQEIIHSGMIISEELTKSIITLYNSEEGKDSCDEIIKMIEQLSQYKDDIEKYTREFLELNNRIFNVNIFCLSVSEQERCSAALIKNYEKIKKDKLKEAQDKEQRVCIYFEMGTSTCGEKGYKYRKEYIYPDGHTEKETDYTNE